MKCNTSCILKDWIDFLMSSCSFGSSYLGLPLNGFAVIWDMHCQHRLSDLRSERWWMFDLFNVFFYLLIYLSVLSAVSNLLCVIAGIAHIPMCLPHIPTWSPHKHNQISNSLNTWIFLNLHPLKFTRFILLHYQVWLKCKFHYT